MGAYGYWVDIAQTLNGFNDGTYWHHGYGKPTDVEARAPIETDGSYYFNKSDMNMKWTGLQTPGTWYVRIWYAKTGTFSNITTYTYPAELTCP
jgi:O-acetylhomoserine/O-acetylserine sulfhydrylase-like pyridoxal-dependent enzyme